jgi:T-complex protein 1 subunit epsilon
MNAVGSLAFDEFGRPFLILRDQENQKRLSGKDAIKVSNLTGTPGCTGMANNLRTLKGF